MSTATISYSDIKNAASEAKAVSRKLDTYADRLTNQIYKKLNDYSGSHTENVSNAISMTNEKISALRTKCTAYSNYSDDLYDLKDTCSSVDKSVKTMVSTLTASFKSSHGIRNSVVQNTVNYYLTSFSNSNSAKRWIKSGAEKVVGVKEYISQSLEDWWDYDGGEQLVKGVLVGLIEIAVAVITIVTLPVSGTIWGIIAATAAVVAATIAGFNGLVNIVNEGRGYFENYYNNDPALARRRSEENTLQDTLCRESDSKEDHFNASLLDGVEFVCSIISIADGIKNFATNGLKWVKENKITKESFKNIGSTIKDGFSDIFKSIKTGNLERFETYTTRVKNDFIYNLRKRFLNFDSATDGAKTIKNYLGITKDLLNNDFSIKNIASVSLEKVVLPSVTLFSINNESPKLVGFMGNQMQFDLFKHITMKDFTDIFTDIGDIFNSELFSESIMDDQVLKKLSTISKVSINVPEISVPTIQISINIPDVNVPTIEVAI